MSWVPAYVVSNLKSKAKIGKTFRDYHTWVLNIDPLFSEPGMLPLSQIRVLLIFFRFQALILGVKLNLKY